MRAVIASGLGVSVGEVPDPDPARGQVLAAPLATGICGSDLHLVHSLARAGADAPAVVPGHEFVAEVLEIAPADPALPAPGWLAPSRRVVSVPHLWHPTGAISLGLSPRSPGGFADRMVLQAQWLLPVPDGLETEHAALTEPLAVGVHAVNAGPPAPGEPAVILGCGPIGLSVLATLRSRGHGPIVAADFSAPRRALAEQIGADIVIDPADRSPYTAWADLGTPEHPPSPLLPHDLGIAPESLVHGGVVFDCVGAPDVLSAVLEGAARHTRLVVVGVCTAPDTFTPVAALMKEITVSFVFGYRPTEFAIALALLADGAVDARRFVTGRVGLDGAKDALQNTQLDHHVKTVVSPGR